MATHRLYSLNSSPKQVYIFSLVLDWMNALPISPVSTSLFQVLAMISRGFTVIVLTSIALMLSPSGLVHYLLHTDLVLYDRSDLTAYTQCMWTY